MYLGVKFLFVLTPSPCGHSPYILLRKTQGERVRCISLLPLLRCYSKRPVMLWSTAGGEGEMYIPFVSASMLFKTPRHVTGYGRRERVKKHF